MCEGPWCEAVEVSPTSWVRHTLHSKLWPAVVCLTSPYTSQQLQPNLCHLPKTFCPRSATLEPMASQGLWVNTDHIKHQRDNYLHFNTHAKQHPDLIPFGSTQKAKNQSRAIKPRYTCESWWTVLVQIFRFLICFPCICDLAVLWILLGVLFSFGCLISCSQS